MAVKVLPLPVAIWIRARGLFGGEALLEVADGRDLGGPELLVAPLGDELGHAAQAAAEGAGGRGVVDAAGDGTVACAAVAASQSASVAGWWKAKTGRERGSGSSPLVKCVSMPVDSYTNGSGRRQAGRRGRQALRVAARLVLDADQRHAGLLGLDDAGGLAVHVEQVVGVAVAAVERELADRDAAGGVDVGVGRRRRHASPPTAAVGRFPAWPVVRASFAFLGPTLAARSPIASLRAAIYSPFAPSSLDLSAR